jgi:LMBR1 domain-containing protein 1
LIPYSYFYYEKEGGHTKVQRRKSAFQYAMIFVILGAFLFMFGLFLKPNILPPHIDLEWFKNLLTESSKFIYLLLRSAIFLIYFIDGGKAVWFVVGCLFIPGMFVFIVYTVSKYTHKLEYD